MSQQVDGASIVAESLKKQGIRLKTIYCIFVKKNYNAKLKKVWNTCLVLLECNMLVFLKQFFIKISIVFFSF